MGVDRKVEIGSERQRHHQFPAARQREIVQGYLDVARDSGLRIAAQAPLPATLPPGGCWVAPTLVADVSPAHRIAQEEIFGPVQAVIPFEGEREALAIANGTPLGLVAGVWTRDGSRAYRMGRAIQAGRVWTNCYHAYPAHAAFGGYKDSGYGRESGMQAIYDYTRPKTAWINISDDPIANPFVMR